MTIRGTVGWRRRRREDGAAAVELALVAPLLFLLVFGIIDFGFGFHAWDAAQNAAREGARVAGVTSDPAQIIGRAEDAAAFLDGGVAASVQCAPAGTSTFGACPSGDAWQEGDLIRVTVEYDYDFITPLQAFTNLAGPLHLTATAETRFEGN
jgi:Flp pilus assembly protein TadG